MDRYRVAPTRPVFLSNTAHGCHHLPPCEAASTGRRSGGAELDIFTAERYFNAADAVKCSAAAVPEDEPLPRRQQQLLAIAAVDATSQSGRTAASSEASWNSRSGLLPSNQSAAPATRQPDKGCDDANGVVAVSNRYHRGSKKPGSGQRWGLFGRDCPCAGRKAVTVDVASEPRSPTTPRVNAYDAGFPMEKSCTVFQAKALPPPSPSDEPAAMMKIITTGSGAFPLRASNNILATAPNKGGSAPPDIGHRVVSSGGFTFPVTVPAKVVIGAVDEPPRESLDLFRPIDEDSVVLVPPPRALSEAGFLRSPAAVTAMDDDAMSDASSDLFDLESFAASSSYPTTYRGLSSRRHSREDDLAYAAAEPALSECMYAPSEASVVWSVATAEGGAFDAGSVANFSSAASACCVDEFRFVPPDAAGGGHDGFTAAMSRSAGRKKGGGGFLNSCRCEKAVSVGPTPVRVSRPPAVPAKTSGHAMGLESDGAARYHHGRVHVPVRT